MPPQYSAAISRESTATCLVDKRDENGRIACTFDRRATLKQQTRPARFKAPSLYQTLRTQATGLSLFMHVYQAYPFP